MANAQLDCKSSAHRKCTEAKTSDEPTDRQLLERFLGRKDESAFEILVRRHGPMVLSVCRRVLDRIQDAEDAFQATFLVLVRKAWSIGNPELLGSWLYGVAFRVARKARAQAARRREQERLMEPMVTGDPLDAVSWKEMQTALDEEMQRLPEKYRQPLILCYLQGMTNEEASRRLGWPTGSISYRLARGREMLRDRMEGRGRAGRGTPAGSLALMLAVGSVRHPVPSQLVVATVQAASRVGAGTAMAGAEVSSAVGSLVEGTLATMARSGTKQWAGLLLAIFAAAAIGTAAVIASQGNLLTPPGDSATDPSLESPAGAHCVPPK
jgi:RNA polymerase sigma factor (sigma-70 family)